MSNINQNTIITLLEEVIPQMQNSDNAEDTLMKFAAEKNLNPSVVERMCHTFNQLKTNCILDHAESMEKRGSSFSLIDGADFVKKYADFAKDLDTSKMEEAIANSKMLWGIPAQDGESSFKLASTKIANKGEFYYKSNYEEKEYSKLDELVKSEQEKLASAPIESKSFDYRDVLDAEKDVEAVEEYITDLSIKQASIINNIVKDLSRDSNKLASFKSDEEDARFLSDDVTGDKIDLLIGEVKNKNDYVASNVKRASDKGKKRLIKQSSDITKNIIAYCENIEKIAAAKEVKDSFEKIARKITDEEMNSLLATGGMAKPFDPADYAPKEEKKEVKAEPKKEKIDTSSLDAFDKKVKAEPKKGNGGNGGNDNGGSSKNERDSDGGKRFNSAKLEKAISSAISDISVGGSKAVDNFLDFNKTLAKLDSETTAKTHPKFNIAKNNILDTISNLNFDRMMMTDPVLSKLSPDEIDNVTEAYLTYKMQYPEIALQPSLLKSVLRSSAQVEGGEDVNSLKTLLDSRKALADARSKEILLG